MLKNSTASYCVDVLLRVAEEQQRIIRFRRARYVEAVKYSEVMR